MAKTAPTPGTYIAWDKEWDKYSKQKGQKLPKDVYFKIWEKKHLEDLLNPIYPQFQNRPKDAMKHLMKVKNGQCTNAFYRQGLGFVDIIWGEVKDPIKHTGFGLSHIIDKHGKDIEARGFKVEDFIAIIIQFADFNKAKKDNEILFESKEFRIIVEETYNGRNKRWILSAFDLRKKAAK